MIDVVMIHLGCVAFKETTPLYSIQSKWTSCPKTWTQWTGLVTHFGSCLLWKFYQIQSAGPSNPFLRQELKQLESRFRKNSTDAVAVSCGYGTCFAVRTCDELYPWVTATDAVDQLLINHMIFMKK